MPVQLKRIPYLLAAGLIAGSMSLPAMAQYTGPSSKSGTKKVEDILKDPVDDADVTLRGYLVRQLGDEKYMFSDGTGEIVVEIDDDDFPRQPVDDATHVELRGEVDTSRKRPPEIDVDKVKVLR